MWSRLGLVIFALAALVALEQPLDAMAQTRRAGDTRGRTRRVRSRSRQGRVSRRPRRRYRRRFRRRRRIYGPTYDPTGCDWVEDGYCYWYDYDYGDSGLVFGFSADFLGGIFWGGDPNGLSTPRASQPIAAGLFGTIGGGARLWLGYDRLRIGGIIGAGGALATERATLPAGGAFEADSETTGGWFIGAWGFGAYQPQLSDLLSLSIGARVGGHLLAAGVTWGGRRYAALERFFFSAGPEIGLIMANRDGVGIGIWGFADLAQPGLGQLTVAFVYDGPHPPGEAF